MHDSDSEPYGSLKHRIHNPDTPNSSKRRWIGVMTVGVVVMVLLMVGGAIVVGLDRDIKTCDVTIEIKRLDLDGDFKDAYDPIGIGKRVNPKLELYIEAAVYGHFIGEGSELQGKIIGDSVYTSQQVKPGDEFTLDEPLRLTVNQSQFQDSDLLRVSVIIIEVDEVPGIVNATVEGAFELIKIPFAGYLLGEAWGELGNWLSANDYVGTATILLRPPDEWTDTSISHEGEDNIEWIHYSLSKGCSYF